MIEDVLMPERSHRKTYLVSLVVGLLLLFLTSLDQGQMLSMIQGQLAYAQNVVHETVHDSRHTAGMPCH